MRLHSLSLQNISSLAGAHKIDFDKALQHSTLFAITGKTGSGKSSILNSISLALYGKVYKEGSQNYDFITLGKSFGEIQLIFSTGSQKYQASWHMKLRKKNGEYYKKPQLTRTLAKLINNELDYIEESAETIIGLNFDQFCKTSILNQGEFAKFLTSSFTERKDILEKFYDGIKLDVLNQTLRLEIRELENSISDKKNELHGLGQTTEDILITPKELTVINEQLESVSKNVELQSLINQHLKDLIDQLKTIQTNIERQNQNKQNLIKNTEVLNIQVDLNKNLIKLSNKKEVELKESKPLLQVCIKNKSEVEALKKELEFLEGQFKKLNQEIEDSKIEIVSLQEKKENIKTGIEELSAESKKFKSTNLRETQSIVENITNELVRINEKKNDCSKKSEQLIQNKEELKKEAIHLSERVEKTSVEKIKKGIEQLEREQEAATQNKFRLEEFEKTDKQLLKLYSLKEEESVKLSALIKTVQKEDESLKLQIQTSLDSIKLFDLQRAIQKCLHASIEKGTCLICHSGSLPEKETILLDEDKIKKLEELRSELETKRSLTTKKIDLTAHQLSQLQVEMRELKLEIEAIKRKKEELAALEKFDHTQKLKNARQELIDLNINQEKLTHYRNKYQELTQLEIENKQILEDQNQQSVKCEEKLRQLARDFNIKDPAQLYSKISILIKETITFEELTTNLSLINSRYDSMIKTQQQNMESATAYSSKIKEILQKKETLTQFLSDNLPANEDPETKLKELEESSREAKTKLDVSTQELSSLRIKEAELKSRNSSAEEQIQNAQLLLEKYKEELAQLRLKASDSFSKEKEGHAKILVFLKKLERLKTNEINPELLLSTHEALISFLSADKESLKELNSHYAASKAILEQKAKSQQKMQLITKEVKRLEAENEKLLNLNALIGKDEFRNYILSIIEKTLIRQTNTELESICQGRYAIEQSHKTNRMLAEFKIIDYFNDGMQRKVSTLSGGETFLVSLAMALALAELTRGQTRLDSLFIDEGFGTLDQESIDEVYELLISLQHSGKQIGIISHIQGLTSRIGTNINLDKNEDGCSSIQVLNN